MSGKSSKKLRKEIRREYGDILELAAMKNEKFLKPKPRFFPQFIWLFFLGFFIRINVKKRKTDVPL